MYIAPNSTIKILKGVPLDPTYEHTLYFNAADPTSEKTRQTNYFSSKAKYTLSNQYYQRAKRGWMRIEKRCEDLYDCNYLMFQNTAFGYKWFYAFIKSVEYVNNEVSEIEYEIDVMQTWYFDFYFEKCFIEREHTASDNAYEHTLPENLNIGTDYVCRSQVTQNMNPNADGSMAVCVLRNRKPAEGSPSASTYTNGVYTACAISRNLRASQPNDIDTWLDQFVEDDIVAIYQYPNILQPNYQIDININNIAQSDLVFGNYVAKNKKLMCYPFCQLIVSNNCGDYAQYKYEYFDHTYPVLNFRLRGVMATEPALILTPKNYKGIADDYDDGIIMADFPQCAWAGDTFKAWWAQNKNSFETAMLTSTISNLLNIGASGVTGNPIGFVSGNANLFSSIANRMAQVEDIKHRPNRTFGSAQTSTMNAAFDKYKFDFYHMKIKEEYARIIDGYFDKFGYAVNKIDIPSRKARPHWTYCKTVGCAIVGTTGVPADDAKKICSIFDNGITHWVNPSEVGNYNLDNRPV